MLEKDTSPNATAEHHRDLDATMPPDSDETVEEFDLDEAPVDDRPEEDDE